MKFNVAGKIALVTGCNRGIGKAIVEALLQHDVAKVYAAVRNPESARPLVEASAGRVTPLQLDLNRPETIAAAAKAATDVQLVINNAGILRTAGPLAEDAIANLAAEIEVNVYGLMRVARAFAPVLAANGGGALVQLNSIASLGCFSDFATYCASKAAAYSITQALRDHLGRQGTIVVSVHPGPIATDMADSAGLGEIAEPPSLVADGIIAALASGEFHVFPDTMARQYWQAYEGFARAIIEADGAAG